MRLERDVSTLIVRGKGRLALQCLRAQITKSQALGRVG